MATKLSGQYLKSGSIPTTALSGGVVSSSAQVVAALPTGALSSSAQVNYGELQNIPSAIVSSSTQVTAFLPMGTVSSSTQLPAGIASSSAQVKDYLPADTVSSSVQVTAFLPVGTVSSSGQVDFGTISNKPTLVSASSQITATQTIGGDGLATTGSNTFTGVTSFSDTSNSTSYLDGAVRVAGGMSIQKDLRISGSMTINGLLTVVSMSSQYVTSSQYNVGVSRITLNDDDNVRFAGMSIYDSGSSNASASIFWDSLQHRFIYENLSGSSYNSAILLAGPQNTGTLGNEVGLTAGRVPVASGDDHIDSRVASSSIRVDFPSKLTHIEAGLYVTESITSSANMNVGGELTASSGVVTGQFRAGNTSPGSNYIDINGPYIGFNTLGSSAFVTLNYSSNHLRIQNSSNTSLYSVYEEDGVTFEGAQNATYNLTAGQNYIWRIGGTERFRISSTATTVTGSLAVSGSVTATTLTGTLQTAAQTNITSVGTLSSLTVNGNVFAGNAGTVTSGFVDGLAIAAWQALGYQPSVGNLLSIGGYRASQWIGINFFTAGTVKATIDSSGNVGIGTTSPGTQMEIYRSTSDRNTITRLLTLNNYSTANPYDGYGTGILFKGTDYSNAVQSFAAIDAVMETSGLATPQPDTAFGAGLRFYTGTNGTLTERVRINTSGSVGIGTTSPNSTLHIRSGGSDRRVLLQLDRPNIPGLQTALQFTVDNILVGQIQHEYPSANYNHMSFTLRSPGGSNFEILRLDNGGNIGIGTTNPSRKLHIYSTDDTRGLLIQNTSATSYAEAHFIANREYRIGTGGASSAGEAANNFYVYDMTATTQRFVINSSGNVGIGTTNPGEKLDVNGSALFRNIIQMNSGNGYGLQFWMKGSSVTSPGSNWHEVHDFGTYTLTAFMLMVGYENNAGDGSNVFTIFVDSGSSSYGAGFSTTRLHGSTSLECRRNGTKLEVRHASGGTENQFLVWQLFLLRGTGE